MQLLTYTTPDGAKGAIPYTRVASVVLRDGVIEVFDITGNVHTFIPGTNDPNHPNKNPRWRDVLGNLRLHTRGGGDE